MTFRQPFDLIAQSAADARTKKAAGGLSDGVRPEWLPDDTQGLKYTSRFVIDLNRERKCRKSRPTEPPKVQRLLARAEEFEALLRSGQALNQAALARRVGFTRARVCQVLSLLRVHPVLLAFIRSLAPGEQPKVLTERRLRALARLEPEEQLRWVQLYLPAALKSRARSA